MESSKRGFWTPRVPTDLSGPVRADETTLNFYQDERNT
jgi:hypothetical protein